MPYKPPQPGSGQAIQECLVCGAPANKRRDLGIWNVACSRCGDFSVSEEAADDCLPISDQKKLALARHLIQKLRDGTRPPVLGSDFFASLADHRLPTPGEMADNLLLWMAQSADGRPGMYVTIDSGALIAAIGATDDTDVYWARDVLATEGLVDISPNPSQSRLTASGWLRVEELKRAHVSSRYAFFARRFASEQLDEIYTRCLQPAVLATGYELRTVLRKAGQIDAIIEDEIRRCRFLLADLSDSNAGAYWEAGFAEGLGKPVIYICREGVDTHFDTDHRQTVRWDLSTLDATAAQLKAVIRNTLLGDAKQDES
ncbi:hypothetical protein ABIF78_007767 [Bradyrhizobium japonicum]